MTGKQFDVLTPSPLQHIGLFLQLISLKPHASADERKVTGLHCNTTTLIKAWMWYSNNNNKQ